MKVLFDLSVLGAAANAHQRGTVGIFRVIEHNARALAASGADVWFYARQNRLATQRYFEEHLAPAALPGSRARFAEPALPGGRPVAAAVTAADDFLSRRYPHPPWRWLASGRVLWAGVRRLLSRVDLAATEGLDIYHSPGAGLPAWTAQPRLRRCLTVYDLIPIIHPEYFPGGTARQLRATLGSITSRDWVFCISESTRRDLLAHYPACDPARTLVIPLAAEDFFHPEADPARLAAIRERYTIPADTPYFLSVSTLEPRKNFESVIRAYARFVRADPARPSRLVLVGGKVRTDTHPIFAALEAEGEDIRRRVLFTGFVADEDLAALYSGALAFVYLSFYEGFGLPPLEAMQCGVPVIVSNTSSLPEVVGDGGTLLAPTDLEGVCAHMHALYHDGDLRRRQSAQALARARKFSWGQFGAQTLAAYHRALLEP